MYQLAFPDAALRPYIENYWAVRPAAGESVDLSVDVYVDARADLVFNFGAPYIRQVLGGPWSEYAASNLDAQRSRPIRIRQQGEVAIVGVRFQTGGLAPFVDLPLQTLTDRTPGLAEVFGPAGLGLEAELETALNASMEAVKASLDAFFSGLLAPDPSRELFWRAKGLIEASAGRLAMAALSAELGLSQRGLARLFGRYLGFSPKAFARIVRFQAALRLLMQASELTLAELASRCGYYDQSHFVRDFKAFTGGVPRGYKGYYPSEAPTDFAPNLVRFVQDDVG